jgi:hypothetical protein
VVVQEAVEEVAVVLEALEVGVEVVEVVALVVVEAVVAQEVEVLVEVVQVVCLRPLHQPSPKLSRSLYRVLQQYF